MPIPEFVLALREHVGTDLLWMPGVTAVVRNDRGEVLLARRSDTGAWSLISGILEPGEQPAAGLVREVQEETGVVVVPRGLASVWVMPEVTYPNGDQARYLDLCFVCDLVSGEARVNDDESTEVGWFALDALPEGLSEPARHKLARALAYDGTTWFASGADGGDHEDHEGAPGGPDVSGRSEPSAASPVLGTLDVGGRVVVVRRAREADVAAIVTLLADDVLGASREQPADNAAYLNAFAAIDADPAQLLVVADDGGEVVATLQLTFIPGLSHVGALRAQVEAVRVAGPCRGTGLGRALLEWAAEEARHRGAAVVQLTTNKQRTDAHRFYERLGFVASHDGMKLPL